jgi:hypothetical protein
LPDVAGICQEFCHVFPNVFGPFEILSEFFRNRLNKVLILFRYRYRLCFSGSDERKRKQGNER